MPITNLLRYSGIGGFSINFGGNVTTPGDVLQHNLPAALFGVTNLTNNTLNTLSNGFIIPYSCILVSASGYSSTASANAKATIHIDRNEVDTLNIINAGNFTNTGKKFLPLLISRIQKIPPGSLIEIRINNGAIGNCQINLYFA
jgi:hypothetical protein